MKAEILDEKEKRQYDDPMEVSIRSINYGFQAIEKGA
jgi:hypothetical protein